MEFVEESPKIGQPLLERWEVKCSGETRPLVIDAAIERIEELLPLTRRDRFVARLCLDEALQIHCKHETGENLVVRAALHCAGDDEWVLRVTGQEVTFGPEILEGSMGEGTISDRGRALKILDQYSRRLVVADEGRQVILWLQIGRDSVEF